MPTARGGLSSAVIGGILYTFGGEGNPDDPVNQVFSNVEAYDMRADVWRSLAPMPVPKHGVGAATLDGKVYIPGGGVRISAAPTNDFGCFHPLYVDCLRAARYRDEVLTVCYKKMSLGAGEVCLRLDLVSTHCPFPSCK